MSVDTFCFPDDPKGPLVVSYLCTFQGEWLITVDNRSVVQEGMIIASSECCWMVPGTWDLED